VEWVATFLKRRRRQPNSAWAFSTIIVFVSVTEHHGSASNQVLRETLVDAAHRCRASIRTLNGPFWARCKLGFDPKPRSITTVMNLGLLGAAIYRAIFNRPAIETQSPEQGGGCRRSPNFPDNPWFWRHQLMSAPLVLPSYNRSDSSSRIRWRVSWLGSPWPLGSRWCHRCPHALA
jgi:hypothetical protein